MAFQVKDFLSILASQVNHLRGVTTRVTDFSVGSVVRSLLEASAIEIEELYQRIFHGLRDAIPTAIYTSFDFPKRPGASARVTLRFSIPAAGAAGTVIPIGTAARVPGGTIQWVTQSVGTIQAGQTSVLIDALASAPGPEGNAAAGSITELVTALGDVSVTNPAAAAAGRNEETDAEQKLRFQAYISSLSRAPLASIKYGAELARVTDGDGVVIEYVKEAFIFEPWVVDDSAQLGLAYCYVWNGVGAATAALVTEAQRLVDGYYRTDGTRVMGWKAAGVAVVVRSVDVVPINVEVTVKIVKGADPNTAVAAASANVSSYIAELPVGSPVYRSELIFAAMAADGIEDAVVLTPIADVAVSPYQKATVGSVTLAAAD